MIDTTINWIEAKQRQRATVAQLSHEMLAALDCGELDLVHALDMALGRAMESPEAAKIEQNLFDQRDPH